MKCARYLLAMCLLVFSMQARADCSDSDSNICTVVNNVQTIWNEITGDVTKMATDLAYQVKQLHDQGAVLIDKVADSLQVLQAVQTPLQQFVDGGTVRCGQGSPCFQFRSDLENFVLDMGALAPVFPQIANSGFGHGQLLGDLIAAAPPLALFGPYQILQRIPHWQDVPMQLGYLYDAVGNPDAFSGVLPSQSQAVTKAAVSLPFDVPTEPTEAFCAKGDRETMDPVRFALIHTGLETLGAGLDIVAGFLPGDTVVVAAGEGGTVAGDPVKGVLEAIPKVITAIFDAVDMYRSRLAVCKGVEADVAGRSTLVMYRTESGVAKAYWVVEGVLKRERSLNPAASYAQADADMRHAYAFASKREWVQAYKAICDGYAVIES